MTLTRLRHVCQVNPATPEFVRLPDDSLVTFLPMEAVWPGGRLDLSQRRPKVEVGTGYTRFQSGDVLVPKITPTFEAARSVLTPELETKAGAGTTELHVLRAGPQIDARYLCYIVNSTPFLKLGEAEMYGVAGHKRVPDEFVRDFVVDLPGVEEQQRIADFLDAETAVIDHIAALRRRQQELLADRLGVALERVLFGLRSAQPIRLKVLLRQKPRYGVLVPEFTDTGVQYIRVNDLLDLSRRASELPRIPLAQSRQYARTIVEAGDILLSVVGTLGRAVVTSAELAGANIARAVCSLRARPDVRPELLVAWTKTPAFARQAVLATGTDTAQPTLGMEDLANFIIHWPRDVSEQDGAVSAVREIMAANEAIRHALSQQESTLGERRSVLITAAVTGQFDVTTARGAQVP